MTNQILLWLVIILATISTSQAQNREYYQIKVYTFDNPVQQKTTDQYLKNAYLPALKKQGIKSIGVFKTRPDQSEGPAKTFVLIPLKKLSQIESITKKLDKNQAYMNAGKSYLNAAFDNPPYARIESIILRAFEKMPRMSPSPLTGPREDRVYELRSYESPTEALYANKVDMFNKGGEVKLFKELGFNAVFYGEVISGSHMPNLMYLTTFSNKKSQEEHWDSFRSAPAWNALKVLPKYQNNMNHSDKFYLYPTEYSDY